MKWIEMIRLIGQCDEQRGVDRLIAPEKIVAQEPGVLDAGIYINSNCANELCLQLLWDNDKPQIRGSRVGLSISEALKPYGMVNHVIWIEQRSYAK